MGENKLSTQLVYVNLGDSILSVCDRSFRQCGKLQKVTGGENVKHIGTEAFYGCSSLTQFDRFTDQNSDHTFDVVGRSAFAYTNLKEIYLSLRSSSIYTFWGANCFAYNNSLRSVHFLSSAFMSKNMFRECHNLTSVQFENNHTSYVYPYVFNKCDSLTSITLPNKIWYLSEYMFNGCSKLKQLKFSSYGDGSKCELIQRGAFNNCKSLSSLKLPKSINSLSCLQDGCFQNMKGLRQIKFYGIKAKELCGTDTKTNEIEYEVGKIYTSNAEKIYNSCIENNIPVAAFLSKSSGCINCTMFKSNMNNTKVKEKISQLNAVILYLESDNKTTNGFNFIANIINEKFPYINTYIFGFLAYKDKIVGFNGQTSFPVNDINKKLNAWGCSEQKQTEKSTKTVVDTIFKSGCFRLNHDVTLISKEGTEINFVYDANNTVSYVDPIEYDSDKTTTSNFKVGKWYYNAKQIKQYADTTGKPLLCIYSLLGCEPCQLYHNNIWDNSDFQTWVQKQGFLFCGIEAEQQAYYDEQLSYCVNEFSKNTFNYIKIGGSSTISNEFGEQFRDYYDETGELNSNLYTPVLIFYHKKSDQSNPSSNYVYTYHNIASQLQNNGVEGTIKILERLCLNHFDNNTIAGAKYCVDVDKPFYLSDMNEYYDYQTLDNYYNSSTKIVNVTSYKNLPYLQSKFKEVFGLSDYVGGCEMDQAFGFFSELGMNENNSSEWNTKLNGVKWKFETTYYTLSCNMIDVKQVDSKCSDSGKASGYKTIWTNVTERKILDVTDKYSTLDAFKNDLCAYINDPDPNLAEKAKDYIGGCAVSHVQIFSRIGLNEYDIQNRPDYFSEIANTYKYNFTNKSYTLSIDISDSIKLRNPCGVSFEAGGVARMDTYRCIWTEA